MGTAGKNDGGQKVKKPSLNLAIRKEIMFKCRCKGYDYKQSRKILRKSFKEYKAAWLQHFGVMQ